MIYKENIEYEIKKLIVKTLDLKVEPSEIENDEILFNGLLGVDSVATLEIIVAIEKKFDIEVADEDLRAELFKNVKALTDYVKKKIII